MQHSKQSLSIYLLLSILMIHHYKLRTQQLETVKSCPDSLGQDISVGFWITSILANIFTIVTSFFILQTGYLYLAKTWQLTAGVIAIGSIVATALITLFLYVYYVYFIHNKSRPNKIN